MANDDKSKRETTPRETTASSTLGFVRSLKIAAVVGIGLIILVKSTFYFLGFEPYGIKRNSIAATMMTLAHKYGIGLGLVSCLQSWGTGGMGMYFCIFLATTILVSAVLTLASCLNGDEGPTKAKTVSSKAKAE